MASFILGNKYTACVFRVIFKMMTLSPLETWDSLPRLHGDQKRNTLTLLLYSLLQNSQHKGVRIEKFFKPLTPALSPAGNNDVVSDVIITNHLFTSYKCLFRVIRYKRNICLYLNLFVSNHMTLSLC